MTRDPRRNAWLDPDPLYVPEQSVQPAPVRARYEFALAAFAAVIVIVAIALALATSRGAPAPSDAPGDQGLRGTPQTTVEPAVASVSGIGPGWGSSPRTDEALGGVPPSAAVLRGWATHCKPTATHCQNWGGKAMLGAVPTFRWGDERYLVQVCGFEGGTTSCVHVTVVSYCACGDRRGIPTVIDLSPAAFRQLAPLSRGVVRVEVSGPIHIPLPETDTGGAP